MFLLLYSNGIEEDAYVLRLLMAKGLFNNFVDCPGFAATTVLAKHGGRQTNHGVYI